MTFLRRNGIALVALVFAMSGTGLAASHYVVTSTSQLSPSVRSALKGARGPEGPMGKQGPQIVGAPGLNGTNGKEGEQGRTGSTGPEGRRGEKGDIGPQGTVSIPEIVKDSELTTERLHFEGKTSNITVAEVEELKAKGIVK